MSRSPTPSQQQAITARGNILVVAGAGAGKTQTVVDRCLAWLLDETNAGSIDEILMVTFTQAAAAEMRQRLRQNLEAAQAKMEANSPSFLRLGEQLALLDSAHICTLHSFCFHLVSRHFHELGLDPKTRILPEERTRLLENQCLGSVLETIYASEDPSAIAIQKLIQSQGGDWDKPVREIILRLHHYTQTLRDPASWFAEQNRRFGSPTPELWLAWLMDELARWRKFWLTALQAQPAANANAARCAKILSTLPDRPTRAQFAEALQGIKDADEDWPKPKNRWRDPIEEIFDEAEFLLSLGQTGDVDPLAQDWQWARGPMLALLDLAGQFGRAFQETKRMEAGMDYHDLEQFALRLLWRNGKPGEVAQEWRRKLRLIFVDEFQDINEAQEAIIQAVGREVADANRFLVGDVKQSIYGFRLADPRIFSKDLAEWSIDPASQVIALTENFRSHEAILHFVNSLFVGLMRQENAGVEYDANAKLLFGNATARAHLSADKTAPPVELLLRCPGRDDQRPKLDKTSSSAEIEARMVGRRLLELKNEGTLIFDHDGHERPVRWNDMVILLRSARHKTESYVKEFAMLGIPLAATRGGFYDSLEVRDMLNILRVLDNPLQDLPLLGVLRSPLVGLTSNELATIRAGHPRGRFWNTLENWHSQTKLRDAHYDKAHEFLESFAIWRKLSRQSAVSHCLEFIIDQTHYGDWIAAQERGEQRRANVERLLQMTLQFDSYDGESLYRFLKFVDAQQESEVAIEPAAVTAEDAVRLMTIHQSKGLEFPVVAVADLGKPFNVSDTRARIMLDEEYGPCPQIQPPETPQFYPSLPHWLAQRRQTRKLLGEEMRLLYVALTRAGQRLILAGTASRKALEETWPAQAAQGRDRSESLGRNYLDWIGPWLLRTAGHDALGDSGKHELISWTLCDEDELQQTEKIPAPVNSSAVEEMEIPTALRDRLLWHYPFRAETQQAAKTTVTTIRRQISDADGEESRPLFRVATRPEARTGSRMSATDVGSAHHAFLQWVSLDKLQTAAALQSEAKRLGEQKLLTPEQIANLNFEALAAFWNSDPGLQLLGQSADLHRELSFTARFSVDEIRQLGGEEFAEVGAAEFVIVQGAVDLAAILPREIWLVDFKTDRFTANDLEGKIKTYRPQIALYAMALERIYRRPVTKRWLHFLNLRHTAPL